jgi:hypothetical protein
MKNSKLDKISLGQIKEVLGLLELSNSTPVKGSLTDGIIGKYVIVRSRNEGINAGFVVNADDTGIILSCARRIWYYKPSSKSVSWYEGVATTGLDERSKVSCVVEEKMIIEDYSTTLCSKLAQKSIMEFKSHEQS